MFVRGCKRPLNDATRSCPVCGLYVCGLSNENSRQHSTEMTPHSLHRERAKVLLYVNKTGRKVSNFGTSLHRLWLVQFLKDHQPMDTLQM